MNSSSNCFRFFIVIMAYAARVSSASQLLPTLRARSYLPSSSHSSGPCCFFIQSSLPIHAVQHSTYLHAKTNNEQRRAPPIQRQSQTQPQRTRTNQPQQNREYSTKSKSPKLERPEVIFSNNHLLVVNKPAGWKSQPGNGGGSMQDGGVDQKCLLSYLKSQSLGGGSQKDFLSPTHRLDQPCTGALIFAKNGKAASRVQVAWAKTKVKKCYWVVVEGGGADRGGRGGRMDGLELLKSRSKHLSKDGNGRQNKSFRLSAILKSTGGKGGGGNARGGRKSSNAGGSVIAKPIPPNYSSSDAENSKDGRVCHIEWEHLLSLPGNSPLSNTRHLLSVTTDTGAKHQVRALLALAGGTPISGDLRYGNNLNSQYYNNNQGEYGQGRVDRPLPDGSVALHARSVFLPTVSLGGMEFLKDEPFVAGIPKRWRDFFGVCEDDVRDF